MVMIGQLEIIPFKDGTLGFKDHDKDEDFLLQPDEVNFLRELLVYKFEVSRR